MPDPSPPPAVPAAQATRPGPVRAWHAVLAADEPAERDRLLHELLAADVVFRSPAVHAPQEGRDLAAAYLRAAMVVLAPTLRYDRELVAPDSACLEFRAELDGRQVHGVDLLRWDEQGRLVDFTVMVRPLRGLEKLVELMQAQLTGHGDERPGPRP